MEWTSAQLQNQTLITADGSEVTLFFKPQNCSGLSTISRCQKSFCLLLNRMSPVLYKKDLSLKFTCRLQQSDPRKTCLTQWRCWPTVKSTDTGFPHQECTLSRLGTQGLTRTETLRHARRKKTSQNVHWIRHNSMVGMRNKGLKRTEILRPAS